MEKKTYLACPVCGGKNLQHYLQCTDFYVSRESYTLMKCEDCHFVFTQDHPSAAHIGPYYESPDYVSHSDTHEGMVNQLYHFARTYMLRHKRNVLLERSSHRTGSILDIGCGTGYFLEQMQKADWKVEGVEKNDRARQAASQRIQQAVKTDLAEIDVNAKKYEIITLWHVLEHLEEPHQVMATVDQLLAPEGMLVIALPNCSSYDARHYQSYWAAYDVPRHIWHFSPPSFERLASSHGFEVQEQLTMPLDAFYISMMSEKYQGKYFSLLRGAIQGLIGGFKSLFQASQSSSIIYILRKK